MSDATALIIHSDPTIRQQLHHALAEERYQVIEAARGEIGLELARRVALDCIILEHRCAYFDGLAVAQALRADSRTYAVPIVVVAPDAADAARFAGTVAQYVPSGAAAPVLEAVQRLCRPPHSPPLRHILLVDEDLEFGQAGAAALEGAGHLVTVCTSGMEALTYLRTHRPHVMILGDSLPEGGVLWFLELVRSELHADQAIPIVWTGYHQPSDAERAQAAAYGITQFLVKPIPPPRIVWAVNQLLAEVV